MNNEEKKEENRKEKSRGRERCDEGEQSGRRSRRGRERGLPILILMLNPWVTTSHGRARQTHGQTYVDYSSYSTSLHGLLYGLVWCVACVMG